MGNKKASILPDTTVLILIAIALALLLAATLYYIVKAYDINLANLESIGP